MHLFTRFKNLTEHQHRFALRTSGAVAALVLVAVFIGGGGLHRSAQTVASIDSASQAAGTALGNSQGVPYAGTWTAYPANYQGCYINWSWRTYNAETGPLCDSPSGSSDWGTASGNSDTFGVGVFSIDSPYTGQGRTVYETRTYTIGGQVYDGGAYCPGWAPPQQDWNSETGFMDPAYCADGSGAPQCWPYGGSSYLVNTSCYHDVPSSLSGPSGNNAVGASSISVPIGTPYTLQWSCLPQRSVYYEYKTGQGTFSTGYWSYGTIYSYGLAQSLYGSTSNDPLFPTSSFAAQGLTGSYTITPNTAGTYTYSLNCYGGSYGMPISVTVQAAAPSAPTASITQSSNSTVAGGAFTVSWSSTNATSCTVSKTTPDGTVTNPWASGTSGSMGATPTQVGTHTWSISCSGAGGSASNSIYHTVTASTPTNTEPRGYLDAASCTFDGWAQDQDAPDVPIDVHFYVGSTFIGAVNASNYRADLCTGIGSCNHGFSYPTPSGYRTGSTYTVTAYAIDTAGGANPIIGSRSFTCAPSVQPSGAIGVSQTAITSGENFSYSGTYRATSPDTLTGYRIYINGVLYYEAGASGTLTTSPTFTYTNPPVGTYLIRPQVKSTQYPTWGYYTESSKTVTVSAPFDFAITTTNKTVTQGTAATHTIDGIRTSGNATSIGSFTLSGLPAGVTASFSPSICTPGTTSALCTTITINPGAATPGTYAVTAYATGGTITRSAPFYLTILSAGAYNFTLGNSGPTSIAQGNSAGTAITAQRTGGLDTVTGSFSTSGLPSGWTASFSPSSCTPTTTNAVCTTMTVGVSASASPGAYPIVVYATGGGVTQSTTVTINVVANTSVTPTVSVVASDSVAGETGASNEGTGYFTITRTADPSRALIVAYTISSGGGNATYGVDYTIDNTSTCTAITATSATIPVGANTCTIVISPQTDGISETNPELVVLTLQ